MTRLRWSLLMPAVFLMVEAWAWAGGKGQLVLALPEIAWSLEIDEPGFVVQEREIAPSGKAARLQAENEATGVILSAFLEQAPREGGAKECREHYWSRAKQSPFKKEQIKLYELGQAAVVEYMVPEHMGVKVNQRNLNAYLAENGYWIDVHLSTSGGGAGTNDPLQAVVQHIRINRAFTPDADARFGFGNMYYGRKDYKKAIAQYERALELEKAKRMLPREMWLILVDQLGMSYGISGDADRAKRLFEWALTQEPDYPMFLYNLACAQAEMGNKAEALRNLRLAFKYKGNMLPGESLPDPTDDSSFKPCLSDKAFRAEVDKLK